MAANGWTETHTGSLQYWTGKDTNLGRTKITGSLTCTIKNDKGVVQSATTQQTPPDGVVLTNDVDAVSVLTDPRWQVSVASTGSGSETNVTADLQITFDDAHTWTDPITGTLTLGGSFPGQGREASAEA